MAEAAKELKSVDRGIETLEGISRSVGERAGEMATHFSDYYANGRKYVKDNPVKGVAVAATAGLVVGSLLTMAFRGTGKQS